MKLFSKLYSDFWINPDNAELMQLGIDAKLMAIYLKGNPHHNILGVYYLPVLYAANDLKQSVKKVQIALKKLCDISYCKYDADTQYVWVCNMALEQIGEEIVTKDNKDNKDNRIKAIQTIWNNLPIKIEFLPEVYNKYYKIFNLASRFINSSSNETKNNSSAKNLIGVGEMYQNINIPAGVTNINSEKEPIIDEHPSIFPAIDLSLNLTSPFEGASKPFQSPLIVKSNYNFSKTNVAATLTKREEENSPAETTYSDTPANTQGMVNKEVYENQEVASTSYEGVVNPLKDSSKGLINPFETPSKSFPTPFEAPSNRLQSPSEVPSEALRSNIEYISKNIEEINKKEEKDLKKRETEEKEKKKKTNNVLISNSIMQVLPYSEKSLRVSNSLSLKPVEKLSELEEAEKTGSLAVDAKKQLIAHEACNLPVVTAASELETNAASIFSVPTAIPAIPIMHDNSVVPIIHTGSVIGVSTDAIVTIFEHWKKIMGYPEAELDYDRKNWISRALKRNNVEKLCEAVTGCFLTPFNMGDNEQGECYNDLHVIFKNNAQIERFVRNSHHPPRPETKAQKRSRKNLQVAKKWSERKSNKSEEYSFFRGDYV